MWICPKCGSESSGPECPRCMTKRDDASALAMPNPFLPQSISLRDFLAGCSLMGKRSSQPYDAADEVALLAYRDADAMLHARQKT